MKLFLVQHGEACTKEINPDRPLTEKGIVDIERLAAFLKSSGLKVDRVIHSGKLRAKQSAERLANAIAPSVELETSGLINPNDNPRAFDWQSDSWDKDIMIVGHLPFMARLVSHLVIEDDSRCITAYTPGSIVCLDLGADMHVQICWMIRPELLK